MVAVTPLRGSKHQLRPKHYSKYKLYSGKLLIKNPFVSSKGLSILYPMDPIPISFKHNGVAYSDCYFTKITRNDGAASFWHLYDCDNYFLGKLHFTDQWTFDVNRKSTGIDKLAEYFGDFVEKANRNKAA